MAGYGTFIYDAKDNSVEKMFTNNKSVSVVSTYGTFTTYERRLDGLEIPVMSLESLAEVGRIKGFKNKISTIETTPTGTHFIVTHYQHASPKSYRGVSLVDARKNRLLNGVLPEDLFDIYFFSEDGRILILQSADKEEILLFDLNTLQVERSLTTGVNLIASSATIPEDGTHLLVGYRDGIVRRYKLQ